MLVLSRKDGQTICIGDEIEITVCEIRNGRVKLGIRCPPDVRILREELTLPREITPNPALVET